MDADEWCVGYMVEFLDGGPAVSCILGFADRTVCERAAVRLPLTHAPYSGPRVPSHASVFACPTRDLTRA
jgi:hypothetical protein